MNHPPFKSGANHLSSHGTGQGKRDNTPAESCQMPEMNYQRDWQVRKKQPGN
jgi:hypothetical protein